jgi:hypothetical protein
MVASPKTSTSDQAPIFEDKSRGFILWIGILATVALGLWMTAGPIYRRVKIWRAKRIVSEARGALATNNLPAVSRAVRAAVELAPGEPEVQRLAGQYCARTRQPEGVTYWELLLKSGTATQADRQEFARFCQNLERLDLSGQLIQELIAADAQNRTNQLLVLDQLARLGEWPKVVTGTEALVKAFPADTELRLMLARAYIGTGIPSNGPPAVELLRTLVNSDSPVRMAAVRTLLAIQGVTPAETQSALALLEHQPSPSITDQLLALEVRERLEPQRRLALAEQFVERISKDAPADEVVIAVEWLRARKLFELALRLTPLDRARTNAGLYLARGELLADLHQWNELAALLNQQKFPVNRVALNCLRAVHAFGIGKRDEAAMYLREAGKFATGNPDFVQQVSVFAIKMGQPALASELWDTLLNNPGTVVPTAAILLRQARTEDDLEIERKVYRQLIGPLGQQPEVRFQHAYLNGLFNERLADAESQLTALLAHDLTSVRYRAALALVKIRLGKGTEALTLCETGDIDWSTQEPRWRAVYATALHAGGQMPAARRIVSKIPLDRLKVPERLLLDGILERK